VILALADSPIIPFNVTYYAERIAHFRDELVDVVGGNLIENSISLGERVDFNYCMYNRDCTK